MPHGSEWDYASFRIQQNTRSWRAPVQKMRWQENSLCWPVTNLKTYLKLFSGSAKTRFKLRVTLSQPWIFFFFPQIVCLVLAALVLLCCVQAFSSCTEWGLLLLGADFSLQWLLLLQTTGSRSWSFIVAECRLSRCGIWTLAGLWQVGSPGQGIKAVSPALADRLLSTVPPGMSSPGSSWFQISILEPSSGIVRWVGTSWLEFAHHQCHHCIYALIFH